MPIKPDHYRLLSCIKTIRFFCQELLRTSSCTLSKFVYYIRMTFPNSFHVSHIWLTVIFVFVLMYILSEMNLTTHPAGWPLWLLVLFLLPAPEPPFPAGSPSACCCPGRSTEPTPAGQIQTSYYNWQCNVHFCNVFRGTHPWPHHCSKGVYGLMNDNVLPYVMVGIFPEAAVDAGNPGWYSVLLHRRLFDVCLSCEERMDQKFNRSDFPV